MIIFSKTFVAVIDDDLSMREAVSGILSSYGLNVLAFDGGTAFLASDALDRVFCAVVDIQMPGLGGLDVQRRLAEAGSDLPLIFMTALDDGRVRAEAMAGGALGYLGKPVDGAQLVRLIGMARALKAV